MSQNDEVTLGYDDGDMQVNNPDPLVSRLGGIPVWLGPSVPQTKPPKGHLVSQDSPVGPSGSSEDQLVCLNCQRRLFLVAQIDGTMEASSSYRVLYLFGCNNGACQRLPGSWRALRGQIPKSRGGGIEPSAVMAQESKAQVDDWGVGGANDWGVAAADDWGSLASGGGLEDFSEVEKALNQHEAMMDAEGGATSSKKKKKGKKESEEGPKNSYLQDDRFREHSFSAHYICFEAEPDPAVFKKTMTKHEKELLDQYERDAAIPKGGADFGEDQDDVEENEHDEIEGEEEEGQSSEAGKAPGKKPSLARELPPRKGKKDKGKGKTKAPSAKGGRGEDAGGDGWGGEEYERFGLKHVEKTLWRFQKRLMVSPTQVLRFPQYGSTPLLYTSDPKYSPPAEELVPRCSHCGSVRKFEMQLMPNTLSLLRPFVATSGAADPAVPLGPISLEETDGMEWSTVLVYTCPLSCTEDNSPLSTSSTATIPQTGISASAKYFDEFIFVQPLL